ncbi:nitrate- and nitrite sensing domain-containing protein [Nonomuraea purpurea]|uniref:histidine kinase n=1 Tax=Nonomuraea purpurea TaxID=1849276 RepID=A0ABV8GPR4_9ACTN
MTQQQTADVHGPRLAHHHRKRRRFLLRDWRVRTRLVALILIPTVVGVLVGAQQVITSWTAASRYQLVMDKAELSDAVIEFTHQLARERDLSVSYVASSRAPAREEPMRAQFAPVDAAAAAVRVRAAMITTAHGESAWTLTQQLLSRLPEIAATRDTVLTSQLLALPALTKYSQIINAFQQFHDQVGQGGGDHEALAGDVRALSALAKAHDAASQQRALLAAAATTGRFQSGEFERFMAARAQQESEVAVFRSAATLDEVQTYDDTVSGTLVDRAEAFRLRTMAQVTGGRGIDLDPERDDDADRWFEAISGTVDGIWTVQRRLGESINIQSRALEDAARRDALLAATNSLLLLLAVLIVTAIMAQSLVRPLRRLRTEALRIAEVRLPETVRALRDSGDDPALAIAPIGVDSRDEVGEVARAFDEVHREAVRLAGEEARLRANVNAMFVGLSRRSQTLVQRQIKLIDGLERGEQDERRLGSLFTLDHLATRMRRNNENLLVLAGQEPPRRWNKPVSLADVVRAGLSEVENYQRVTVQITDRSAISGQAVNDIIHLLAELVENALSFSPHTTPVLVSAGVVEGGGILLAINDTGIGMVPDELAEANQRLARAPVVDVSVSRRMGLFVVARLAHRHGIRVQLRENSSKGLTATVFLPAALLHLAPYPTPAASVPVRPAAMAHWPSFATDPSYPGGVPYLSDSSFITDPPPLDLPRGAAPAVNGHAVAAAADDYLPIFAAVESAWFSRNRTEADWGSPQTDAGWSAAEAAAKPANDGSTPSGLPKRVPKANLIPGAAATESVPKGVAPIPRISPEQVRDRLAGYQQGFRTARDNISTRSIPPFAPGIPNIEEDR